jgi:hypothetical protein
MVCHHRPPHPRSLTCQSQLTDTPDSLAGSRCSTTFSPSASQNAPFFSSSSDSVPERPSATPHGVSSSLSRCIRSSPSFSLLFNVCQYRICGAQLRRESVWTGRLWVWCCTRLVSQRILPFGWCRSRRCGGSGCRHGRR